MRTIKFDKDTSDDDIIYASTNNPNKVSIESIDRIVAEVCGENEGVNWHWVIQKTDGKFQYLYGGCDYTGWDCQSFLEATKPELSIDDVIAKIPEREYEETGRFIRKNIQAQIEDKQPFALYFE